MEQLDDLQAVTQSIGEHILDLVGRDALHGLQVVLDERSLDANVTLALRDTSWPERSRAWHCIFEVEDIFWSEVVLHCRFTKPENFDPSPTTKALEYSYA